MGTHWQMADDYCQGYGYTLTSAQLVSAISLTRGTPGAKRGAACGAGRAGRAGPNRSGWSRSDPNTPQNMGSSAAAYFALGSEKGEGQSIGIVKVGEWRG